MRNWLFGLMLGGTLLGTTATSTANPIIYGSAFTATQATGPNIAPATLYSISPANGVATPIGPIGFNGVGSLDFGPNGFLYGVGYPIIPITGDSSVLLTINPATGVGTAVGPTGLRGNFQDIAFRPSDGTLFAYVQGGIYTLNTTTGAATKVGDTGAFPDGNGLAFSSTNILYNAESQSLYTIDQSTAAPTLVTNLDFSAFTGTNPRANGMKFDPLTGTLWASVVTDAVGTFPHINYLGTIDIGTGVVADIGTTISGLDAIAVASVPEPTTLLLLGSGLAGLAVWRRRQVA